MKSIKKFLFIAVIVFGLAIEVAAAGFIIDHTHTDLSQIPEQWITAAKANLGVVYNRTSHGGQVFTGMTALANFPNFGTKYSWTDTETPNSNTLCISNTGIDGWPDLSQGDRDTGGLEDILDWAEDTYAYLTEEDAEGNYVHENINVVMWSWCDIAGHNIPLYLASMDWLIEQFSEGGAHARAATHPVKFVYMTGHANGGGENDSSDSQNELIRTHCNTHDRILFDFSDIENYDPDENYFLDAGLNDTLDYDPDYGPSRDSNWDPENPGPIVRTANWASEYLDRHPDSELDQLTHGVGVSGYDGCTTCAHSNGGGLDARLNCVLKGRAVWALFARLAGWVECTQAPADLDATLDETIPLHINVDLSWTDNSLEEAYYIVQRRVPAGIWAQIGANLPADSITYTDVDVAAGTYEYRVLAHKSSGDNSPCDSASSMQSVTIVNPVPPDPPSDLALVINQHTRTVSLSWTDNSNNETGFNVWRKLSTQIWSEVLNPIAQVNAGVTSYDNTGVDPETYTYKIEAYNVHGKSETSDEEGTIEDIPEAPSDLDAATDSAAGEIVLTWQDNSDNEDGFTIEKENTGIWETLDTVGANVETYTDDSLINGTYTYRVFAFAAGVTDSGPSNEATGVISNLPPDAPTNFDAVLTGFDAELTWQDNSDNEESFVLYQSVDGGDFSVIETLGPDTVSFTVLNLPPLHEYTFYVIARNSIDDSSDSNTDSVYVAQEKFTVHLDTPEENVEDAFLMESYPDTNSGGERYMSNFDRFLIRFNLPPEVLNKHIISAKFSIYVWSVDEGDPNDPDDTGIIGNQYILYNITQDWEEDTVTWNTPWPSGSGGGAYGDEIGILTMHNSSGDYDHEYLDEVELKDIVQDWADGVTPNFGFLLISNGDDFGLKASEYGSHSYLEITYSNKPDCTTDFDDDGDVDGEDLYEFTQQFCDCCLDDIAASFGQ
ncbi:MAG: fibronectin type III domain-containing protein [Desulfobacteraceae bacterium]|nr:fibronectin type III domain-containing protein [Desulfobacteraceae bacterium]